MTTTISTKEATRGAMFILSSSEEGDIFSPENLSEEQVMIRNTVRQFVDQDHARFSDRMENGEHDLNRKLLKILGDLGLLGTHMPEQYGGMQLDTNTNTFILEEFGRTGAFSTTVGAHTGIGMLPILYFGTEEQKAKYLPPLIRGDKVACYCLTEPGSGSDALAAKTRADLSEDGQHYILNGQKMWISNAGFADVFIVFAKINGTDFTAFIVEKNMVGLSLAAEEKKLGIKGSSTRQVFFENVYVPVENLLGEPGKGHHIAFNVLNTGRFKIGPAALGGSKSLCNLSIQYANERIQFGRKISSFGAIKEKIAKQATDTFAAESAVYRTSGLIQEYVKSLSEEGKSYAESKLLAAEEFALESSILKVAMTDILNDIASECVQIHGGMGYSEETAAARAFRDARIAMIYEGTNEINRLLMTSMIFKRAMGGQLDIATAAQRIKDEMRSGEITEPHALGFASALMNFKKVAILLLGSLGEKAMTGKINLKEEQEILLYVADILIDIFLAESVYLRVNQITQKENEVPSAVYEAMVGLYMNDASFRIQRNAMECVGSFIEPEKLKSLLGVIAFLTSYPMKNQVKLKRIVADYLIKRNSYVF